MHSAAWCAGLGFLAFTFQPYFEGRLLSKAQWLSNDIQGFQLNPKLPSIHKTSRKASMSLWSLVTTLTKTLFVCPWPIKQHILVVSPTVVSHRSCGNVTCMERLGVSEDLQRGTAHRQKTVCCITETPGAISRKVFTHPWSLELKSESPAEKLHLRNLQWRLQTCTLPLTFSLLSKSWAAPVLHEGQGPTTHTHLTVAWEHCNSGNSFANKNAGF